MGISVDDIKDIYMEEDSSKELIDIGSDFYKSVKELLEDLYNESDEEVEFVINKINNYFEEIVNIRRKKILKRLIPLVLDGQENISFNMSNLTPEEKEFVSKLIETSEGFNKKVNNIKKVRRNENNKKSDNNVEDEGEEVKNIVEEKEIGIINKEDFSFVNSEGVEWKNLPKNSLIFVSKEDILENVEISNIERGD